jgi:hypothetical protein
LKEYQTSVSSYWVLVSGFLLTLLVRRLSKPFRLICCFPLAAWSPNVTFKKCYIRPLDSNSFMVSIPIFPPFSPDFSPKVFIPDSSPEIPDLSPEIQSSVLDCSRLFCGPYASTVPKNYDYRRLEAKINPEGHEVAPANHTGFFSKTYRILLQTLPDFFPKLWRKIRYGVSGCHITDVIPDFSPNKPHFSPKIKRSRGLSWTAAACSSRLRRASRTSG